jgi:hypothetical protein
MVQKGSDPFLGVAVTGQRKGYDRDVMWKFDLLVVRMTSRLRVRSENGKSKFNLCHKRASMGIAVILQ